MDMTPKSPEPESETPTRIQPAKPISFSNGIIKRHHHVHHHTTTFTYKECLKNHAAAIGGHALDGCGEFMPSPSSTPSDPTSLKCAACGCHRNFHRRDPEDSSLTSAVPPPPSLPPSSTTAAIEYQPHHRHHPPPPAPPLPRSPTSSSPPPISSSYMLLALSGNNKPGGNNLPFSDLNFAANNLSTHHHHHTPGSRKRFRTKFSQTQKDKMHEFADRIGWKIQKRDEDEVREFCRDVGVDKGVLKVWMHNNKNNRRDQLFSGDTTVQRVDNGLVVSGGENNNNNNNNADDVGVHGGNGLEHDLQHGNGGRFESDSGGAAANGSSSTS